MDAPSDLGSPGAAPAPPRPEGPSGPRRLRRRPDDGHIAGVCAGVAEYFNVDPVLVRIAAVVLAFSGPGVIAYILAWIFVPADPGLARYGEPQAPIDRKDRATQIFGIVLVGLGVSVIWGDWWSPLHGWLFPLGLIALGAWLLLRSDGDDPPDPAGPAPAVDDLGDGDASTDPTAVQPDLSDAGSGGDGADVPPAAPWDVPPPPSPPVGGADPWTAPARNHRHRHRHLVGPGVFGVLLIWTGVAWLAGVGLTTGLAVGL